MREDWKRVSWAEADEIIAREGLQGITWTTLDSGWYFREIEYADEAKTAYSFPGSNPLVIKYLGHGDGGYAKVSPELLQD